MDKYLLLTGIVLSVTIVSFIIEYIAPIIKNYGKYKESIKNGVYRFLHYYVFLYIGLFLFLFKTNSVHAYLYLFITLGLFCHWYLCECCVLTFLELKSYDVDHNEYPTTFHPTFNSLFRNYADTFMSVVSVIFLITIGSVFYYNKSMPLYIKGLYTVFAVFFLKESVVRQRMNNQIDYPTDSRSFFMKYIHC